jgi:hypothetical protein
VEVRKMTSAQFDELATPQERAMLRLQGEIRMVQDAHHQADELLCILYTMKQRCEEIAVRVDEVTCRTMMGKRERGFRHARQAHYPV